MQISKVAFGIVFAVMSQIAQCDVIYNVSINTSAIVGHPAGPFYLELAFTDGSGVGDANNTVALSNFSFGGGSGLGSPIVFGGAAGSLETGVQITDNSFLSLFGEAFAPGLQLSFSLDVSSNNNPDGVPDRLTLYILDSSGVPLPTLAPAGDYFLGVDLGSAGPKFDAWGSDPSRAPSIGNPVSIPAATITAASAIPEPSATCLVGLVMVTVVATYRKMRDQAVASESGASCGNALLALKANEGKI